MRLLALLPMVLLLAACSSPTSRTDSIDYQPIPDPQLFAQVDDLRGVASADLLYNSTLGNDGYGGTIRIEPDLDQDTVVDTVDRVYAILRQGRYQASISIRFIQGNRVLQSLPGLPSNGSTTQLERFYGPQPGDGTPPPR